MTAQLIRPRAKAVEAISTNFDAFEVIRRGDTIVIESPVDIDTEALASGLRFVNGPARPEIAARGRRVTISVDEAFPLGRNVLILSDLYTPDHEAIVCDIETPFFVIESKVKVPAGVRLESYSRVVVSDGRLQRAGEDGGNVYELTKGTVRDGAERWECAFDGEGRRVDFAEVRAGVMKERLGRFGKLQPALFDRLNGDDDGPLSVAIWLSADLGPKPRKVSKGEIAEAPKGNERLEAATRRFAERNKLFERAKNVRLDPAAPVVFAELPAEEVRRLAEQEDVSAIFLYNRRGIDDLGTSIAIARTDDAHALGYNGTGVNVAVFEGAPDDTSLLSITARYTSSPDVSTQHSRHTHGIIKNVERGAPHGHAPASRLHSANDYDLDAIRWAAQDRGCTVISQSFHRDEEEGADTSFDDIYKDWLALNWPYPTICEAAGNGADSEYVNHKGYNRLTVANHNDGANGLSSSSVFRNPPSAHGDRELPEIAANGTGVDAVDLVLSGTSMAAPAVAGSTACVQEVNGTLKSWPEGCRAIQLAAARLNPNGSGWWSDVNSGVDGQDGSGALDTLNAVRIAEQRKGRNNAASARGWDVGTLRDRDIGRNDETTFSYRISVPAFPFLSRTTVKVALAWDSDVVEFNFLGIRFPINTVLTHDLDLKVYDSRGNLVGYSGSWDNSYEIAEFRGVPGETYTVKVRRWSGTGDIWYGLAWNVTSRLLVLEGFEGASVLQP